MIPRQRRQDSGQNQFQPISLWLLKLNQYPRGVGQCLDVTASLEKIQHAMIWVVLQIMVPLRVPDVVWHAYKKRTLTGTLT